LLPLALLAGDCGQDLPSPPVREDLRAHDIDAETGLDSTKPRAL